ncbi:unnamed protein product [Rangifer tarandus platyrhynchus]|uniref:Uncharacterized protein n=1 Tax=Rangifer tarandus platyrhynchus TaxID=3082113 RepID=A0AC59YWK1_RANTA
MSRTLGLDQCEFTLLAGRLGPPTSNGTQPRVSPVDPAPLFLQGRGEGSPRSTSSSILRGRAVSSLAHRLSN